MSSAASADPVPSKSPDQTVNPNKESDCMDSNHDLPARTVADDDSRDSSEKDDAATMAASEELKHTSISDHASAEDPPATLLEDVTDDKNMGEAGKQSTPEPEPTDAQDEEMRERLSSPKKKRGRDQVDDNKDLEGGKVDEVGSSADGTTVNGNRTERLGPEKKRHRDTSEDILKAAEAKEVGVVDSSDATQTTTVDAEVSEKSPVSSPIFGTGLSDRPQTSSGAFASSGFSSLAASSASPFGTIGASKPSVFNGNTLPTKSGFGALAGAQSSITASPIATGGFGALSADKPATGFGFGGGSTSGFSALGSGTVFGSTLGNGFAGGSGPKLSSFAAPGKENVSLNKPAKAFGAPDSDEEDGSDDDGSEGGADINEEERLKSSADDKKKAKVTKVHIEDGESGEATLLQLRAKLFALDSKETGWKERGVGTLKVNVPKGCATFDENGVPMPGSFDASGFDDEDEEDSTAARVPRLIMRQENTHRVILNTIIVRAMEFRDKPSTGAAQILFTAFEGEKEPKPINMLLKMSDANARLFRSEIDSIQHELL